GVLVDLLLGLGQRLGEALEEVVVEDEIAQAPAEEGRAVGEGGQALAGFLDQVPGQVARAQRNILHEAGDGAAVGPAVVGRHQGIAHFRRQRPHHPLLRRAGGEGVEAAHRPLADGEIAAQLQLPGHGLGRRQREGGGVEDDQALDAVRVLERPAEADHAAPVVHGQGEVVTQAQVLDQPVQVLDAAAQGVAVGLVIGLVRQAHADVVGHDAAAAIAQAQHQVPPVVGPGGIAVQHQHRIALALVQIALGEAIGVHQVLRLEGVIRERPLGQDAGLLGGEGGFVHRAAIVPAKTPPLSPARHLPSPLAGEGSGERAQGLPGGGTSWILKAMIVYQSTKSGFIRDTFDHAIEAIISDAWLKRTGRYAPHAEVQAWQNSLESMAMVLDHPDIEDDVGIGVEFGIPQTAKRMDFLLTGRDESGRDRLVIVELKQWSDAKVSDKDGIIIARRGGRSGEIEGPHPSYQAWSYAALLEGFSEAVYEGNVGLGPCAYLHNFRQKGVLDDPRYAEYLKLAPVFLRGSEEKAKLRAFIRQHVRHGDKGELLYRIENGRIRPSKILADSLASMLKGNREFVLVDDQKLVFE